MDDYTDRLEYLYSKLSKESRVRLGIQKRNIILKCDYEGDEEVDCMDNITQLFDFHNGNCYTANAIWGEPSKTGFVATHWNPKNSDPCEIKLYVNMEANDYTPMDSTVRLNFILHSPYIIPKTNHQAMEFLPGFRYKMRIDKKIFRFLPPPYKTACFDYSSLKEKRMNATMTEEDCFDECFWNSSLHVCGCTNERLGVLLGGKVCDENDCLDEVYKRHFNSCFSMCPKACSEENYSITSMDVLPWPSFNHQYEEFPQVHFDNITHARSSLLRLRIWYPRMIETTYSHQPKYEGIELFGALGGYIGLWLGVSLTTLYDIMVPLCARGLRATNNFLFQK
ncbi:epithelial sodium channel subunit beta-like isoform X2 [Tachypleus tridentatus]